LGKKAGFIEKNGFLISGQGDLPPYTLSGPTNKKTTLFMCVFPYNFGLF